MTTGTCKHGQFDLTEGCPQCIAEQRESIEKYAGPTEAPPAETADSERFLVKIRYYSTSTGEASGQEYTYFSENRLNVGDVVRVPVRNREATGVVTEVDVPEAEVAEYSDLIKTIPAQVPIETGAIVQFELTVAVPAEPEAEEEPTAGPPAGATSAESPIEITGGDEEAEVPVNKAVIQIDPESDPRVVALYQEALHLQELAEAREITTNEDLKPATEDLAAIAKLKKALTERKTEFVAPVREYLDGFNDAFKTLMAPILAADRITRDKMKRFGEDQQRRIDEAAQLDADKLNVAKREAALHQGEHTQDLTPAEAPPAVPQRVRTDIGTTGTSMVHKWEPVDLAQVPIEYLMIDAGKVGRVVKASKGTIIIPGIRVWSEPTITVRTQ